MTQRTEAKHDLLKQNFELTLIIIFIGLAFGLVGLIVPTAAVMSIVVISVGVIVGFVSYRDAFIPRPNGEVATSAPIAQISPASAAIKPEPRPQPTAPRPQQITPIQRQVEEPLPRLPKIQRISTQEEPAFSSPTKPTKIVNQPQQAISPIPSMTSQASTTQQSQDRLAKPRKPRARRPVDASNDGEETKN